MRTRWRITVIAVLLAVAGASFAAAGWLSRHARVDAIETAAFVVRDLRVSECRAGQPVRVSFAWLGHPTTGDDQAPCTRDYLTNESVTIYVASNDSSNIGPTKEWILDPSAHDPFDVGDPNDLPLLAALPGIGALSGAVLLGVLGFRSRRTPARVGSG